MGNKCENCTEKCPQAEMAHQAALGRMYATKEFTTLLKKAENGELVKAVHGRWKFLNDYQSQCSECFDISWVDHDNEPNYCPNCGAKMDGDGNG